jgi:DNA primase
MIDESVKNQIRQATDIVDLVGEHLSLIRKGKDWVGVCPFHEDHRPSMYVSPVKQLFKCFACGAGGDVFKFVQMRENLNFPEAIERLGERVGIKVENVQRPRRRVSSETGLEIKEIDPRYLARLNDWSQKHWVGNYKDEQKGKSARKYVEQRQISDESVETWGIGFALDSWDGLVNAAGGTKIPPSLMVDGGVAVSRDAGKGMYDKFRNRLMFPIVDVTGRIIGFGGRTLGDDPAKYMNSPATVLFDKSNSLYGLDKARHEIAKSGTVVIVEGYTDVIMCHQFGVSNVVATLGTSLTVGHVKILRRYAKKIVLLFDSDVAGMAAANRGLEVCLSENIDIKLAFASEGKDPCEFLLTAGREAFVDMVDNAEDVMAFKWSRLVEGLDGSDTIVDKKAVVEEYLRTVVAGMQGGKIDGLARGLIVSKMSGIIGMDSAAIEKLIAQMNSRANRNASYAVQDQTVVSVNLGQGKFAKAQHEIIEVLVCAPNLYSKVSAVMKAEDFSVPVLREIAVVLFEMLESGREFDFLELLGRIESVETSSALVGMNDVGNAKGDVRDRIKGALAFIEGPMHLGRHNRIKAALVENEDDALVRLTESLRMKNV